MDFLENNFFTCLELWISLPTFGCTKDWASSFRRIMMDDCCGGGGGGAAPNHLPSCTCILF